MFCPSCGHQTEGDAGKTLCIGCGDALQSQGFCPICERHLPMPVGAICPKHDVKLEFDEPDPESHDRDDQSISWVTVSKFRR